MNRNTKKGFTIVELIIVIAVIAVLAAVLIPTFSNLINQAQQAKDTALVSDLNKGLKMSGKEFDTMHDALTAVEENVGINVAKINAVASESEILWDSVNQCFVYLKSGDTEPTYIPDSKSKDVNGQYDYWQIVKAPTATNVYSQYISGTDYTADVVVSTGLDVGANAQIKSIKYENATGSHAVIIRTCSTATNIEVNAPTDTVKHFDAVGTVKVVSVDKTASYHEFGNANTLIVNDGHIVVENNATVANVVVEKSENANVSLDNKGSVDLVAGADSTVTVSGVSEEKKIETVSTLTENGGYVKLTTDQSIASTLSINKDTILDLNGKTITVANNAYIDIAKNFTIIDSSNDDSGKIQKDFAEGCSLIEVTAGGNLIVNGGTLSIKGSYNTASSSYKQVINVNEDSSLTVNGGTIHNICSTSDENDYTGAGIGAWKTAVVTINNGSIKSDHGYAIAGNGAKGEGGTTITVNGGEITGGEIAIYNPQYGSLQINGGTIKAETCVYVKSGALAVNGGVFNAIGAKKEFVHHGDGADPTGDCIVIESCAYPGGTPMVYAIKNAKMTSANGKLIVGYVYQNNAEITISSDLPFDIYHVE